jgi:glycosyltransferase involved in cell wall biosynthesis
MNDAPLVSIIMPAYNAQDTIKYSINSVLSQSYTNFELLIADDGSTDSTADIVNSFSDKRIVYLYQEQSGVGCPGSARNLAISSSKGEFIAFLDSDDLWHPDKLKIQLSCLYDNPQVDLVYSNYYSFTSSLSKLRLGDSYEPKLFQSQFGNLLVKNYIPTLTVIVKASALQHVGFFRTDLHGVEDWDLWLRLSKIYKFKYIDFPLAYYRLSSNSLSGNRLSHLRYESDLLNEYIMTDISIPSIVAFSALAFLEAKSFKYLCSSQSYSAASQSFLKLSSLVTKVFPLSFQFLYLLARTSIFQIVFSKSADRYPLD